MVNSQQEAPIMLFNVIPPSTSTEAVIAPLLSIRISEASVTAKSQRATRATLILNIGASDAE